MSNQNIKNIVKTELDGLGTIMFLFTFAILGEIYFSNGFAQDSKSNDTQIKEETKTVSQPLGVAKKQNTLDSLQYYKQKTR